MTLGGRVVIHMLGPRSRHLAERMAGDHDLRFEGDHWHIGPHDLPVLDGATAWMIGRIIEIHPVYDNAVVVVEVEGGGTGDEDEALLYHERTYRRPGANA